MTPPAWPYPFWIAHRGAGRLAPENTLAAFRLGARHGYRMFECDAKLSADGVVFLLHDGTLERTTSGQGTAGDQPWAALAQLDAGGWHSRAWAGEPIPTLDNLARWCLANHHLLDIEIKPTPGTEAATGRAVATLAARLWQGAAVPPLLTSFQTDALRSLFGAVERGDKNAFRGISGVGKKTVEHLLVDLKGKLSPSASRLPARPVPSRPTGFGGQGEILIGLLVNLGYKRPEAERALDPLDPASLTEKPVQELLREALRHLSA